jgi:cytochrome c oxidase cbb3-type subunit 3
MTRHRHRLFVAGAGLLLLVAGVALTSCQREDRDFRVQPPLADTVQGVTVSSLRPGPNQPPTIAHAQNRYEMNAYAIAQGKTLYNNYNCSGCHANGGGGMGPALVDEKWIYGSEPEQVFATIVEGRPNGMPSWRGRIPDYQVWQIVAFVRSMSGQVSKTAAPGRDDHMQGKIPENSVPKLLPKNSFVPPSALTP